MIEDGQPLAWRRHRQAFRQPALVLGIAEQAAADVDQIGPAARRQRLLQGRAPVAGPADQRDRLAGVVELQRGEADLEGAAGHVELDRPLRHAGIGPLI